MQRKQNLVNQMRAKQTQRKEANEAEMRELGVRSRSVCTVVDLRKNHMHNAYGMKCIKYMISIFEVKDINRHAKHNVHFWFV